RRWSSHRGEPSEAPADLVERDFHAGAPNRPWPTDAARSAMDGHKRRPSPVIDRFDGMVVSWRLSRSPDAAMADG
ncbi:IS3 family transposase, partial [Bifidobacterium pullorum subsp. saeculare]|nr:IS3 family transposase [Bifidobacterium pullorum subsp. saeculare]